MLGATLQVCSILWVPRAEVIYGKRLLSQNCASRHGHWRRRCCSRRQCGEYLNLHLAPFSISLFWAGSPAHPTRKLTLCGTGILPVLENHATYQSKNFLAQLGKNLCNFVQDIIAVSAAKLVNAGFIPTFVLVIIDDRSLDFDRVEMILNRSFIYFW